MFFSKFSHSVMSDSLQPHGLLASLSFTISWSLLKLMPSESMMPSNHLILCRSLLLLPSIFLSIRVFSNVLALGIRWPNCWSFSNNPFNEYWFPLGLTGLLSLLSQCLSSLLQDHSSKASILWHLDFFTVHLSYLDLTTGKPELWCYGSLLAKWCLYFSIPLDYEIFAPCFMYLDMFQCVLVYSLWELE